MLFITLDVELAAVEHASVAELGLFLSISLLPKEAVDDLGEDDETADAEEDGTSGGGGGVGGVPRSDVLGSGRGDCGVGGDSGGGGVDLNEVSRDEVGANESDSKSNENREANTHDDDFFEVV